jgi:hypothetical protein
LGVKLCDIYEDYVDDLSGDRESEYLMLHGRYKGERSKYANSWEAAMRAGTPKEIAEIALRLYKGLDWEAGFGGDKWADIAQGWLNLNKAKTRGDMLVHIDRVYQLQHNNDTVFNKIIDYMKGGNHQWLKRALDQKFASRSPYDLLPKASSEMQRLASYILKSAHGTTLQSHRQQREADYEGKFPSSKMVRPVAFKWWGGRRTVLVPENELRSYVKRIREGDLDEVMGDMIVKYGDKLHTEAAFERFFKEIGIELPFKLDWSKAIEKVKDRAKVFVAHHFDELNEVYKKLEEGDWRALDRFGDEIAKKYKTNNIFADAIKNEYNAKRYQKERLTPKDVRGGISHEQTDKYGPIKFHLPNELGAWLPNRGTTVPLATSLVQRVKQYYDHTAIEDYMSLSDKAITALVDYIYKNYDSIIPPLKWRYPEKRSHRVSTEA